MTSDTGDDAGLVARLRRVVFAYERGADLPAATDLDDQLPDPDARGGPVLRGVDMDVPAGSFTVIMGASGGGKSTLLRTLNAIIPDFINGTFDGDVEVFGRDATATRVAEMARDVGMVLQDYESQLFGTSLTAEVAFGPENLAVPADEIDARIDRAIDVVGLSTLDRERSPAGLSGGQKQRLVFAGVLAMYPDLLVLDEPTSDLDPEGTRDILEVVGKLATEAGTDDIAPESIVMVTHKIEEALLADRAVLLRGGQVYREGPVADVFTDAEALRESRVAVPPLVAAFDRAGWPSDDLPLRPADAADLIRESEVTWTPPATADDEVPGAPAGTGETLGEPLFELDGVSYAYETDRGPVQAVDGVSLSVREGEVVAIVGHNGSGKTTLAKHLNGLNSPDEGQVRYRGQPLTDLSTADVGQEVGYVFQNPDHQIFAATVREEVAFGPENFGLEGAELDRKVAEAIETVELDGLEEADPFNLSKGQRQRVALAGVLATDPDAIVFDEPATGLDAQQQDRFMDLVARLNRESGVTVVMVTHDMDSVARYAPRTAVMKDGALAYDGSTRRLFADEDALGAYDLRPPHVVDVSNRIGDTGDLPALSVDELVAALGGADALATADTTAGGERE